MKKLVFALILCTLIPGLSQARTVYVTDHIKFTLRTTESNRSKIVKMLPSGTALTVLDDKRGSGYIKVRTRSGTEGFILNRHVSDKPISKFFLDKANQQLQQLQQENDLIKQELSSLKGENQSTLTSHQSLASERDKLSTELNQLKQTAANAVQLKHQRDQLQERVISVERELQQLKRENQAMIDSSNQDWFLYGGILSLCGVILGFILPKLGWRQKTRKWDTF